MRRGPLGGRRRWLRLLARGIAHAFVVSEGPLRGLQITSPAGFERFLDELGRPPGSPGLPEPSEPDVPRLVEVAQRYGHQIVGPPLSLPDAGVEEQWRAGHAGVA